MYLLSSCKTQLIYPFLWKPPLFSSTTFRVRDFLLFSAATVWICQYHDNTLRLYISMSLSHTSLRTCEGHGVHLSLLCVSSSQVKSLVQSMLRAVWLFARLISWLDGSSTCSLWQWWGRKHCEFHHFPSLSIWLKVFLGIQDFSSSRDFSVPEKPLKL